MPSEHITASDESRGTREDVSDCAVHEECVAFTGHSTRFDCLDNEK